MKRILVVSVVVAVVVSFFCNSSSFAEKRRDKIAEKFKDHKSYSNVNDDPAYKRAKKELTAVQKIEQLELNALQAKERTEMVAVHAKEVAIFEAEWKKGTVDIEAIKKDLQKKYQDRKSGDGGVSKEVESSVEVPISEKSQEDINKMIEETREKARKWLNDRENSAEPVKDESDVQSSIDKAREKAKEWIESKKTESGS